jgi:hypothetical protein
VHYLGLDLDDVSAAIQRLAQYQKSLIVPKTEHFEVSQMESGQGGIITHKNDWLTVEIARTRADSRFRGYER